VSEVFCINPILQAEISRQLYFALAWVITAFAPHYNVLNQFLYRVLLCKSESSKKSFSPTYSGYLLPHEKSSWNLGLQ
jgi:hypothetical protein